MKWKRELNRKRRSGVGKRRDLKAAAWGTPEERATRQERDSHPCILLHASKKTPAGIEVECREDTHRRKVIITLPHAPLFTSSRACSCPVWAYHHPSSSSPSTHSHQLKTSHHCSSRTSSCHQIQTSRPSSGVSCCDHLRHPWPSVLPDLPWL